MQITPLTISIIGILISAIGVFITIYTIVKANAKTQQSLESRFDVVDVEISHIKQDQKQLSERVEKHNKVIERTFKLEENVKENARDIVELKTDMKEIEHHIRSA